MEKVKLPREVAEAIETLRAKDNNNENIVMFAMNPKGNDGFTIARNIKDGLITFDTFLQALVNGYEVEETPEDKVKRLYSRPDNQFADAQSYRIGMKDVLEAYDIKIEGVNA